MSKTVSLSIELEESRLLVEQSAFLPSEIKNKIIKKLESGISREKLAEAHKMLEKLIQEEDKFIREKLTEDPAYFKKIKKKVTREKTQEREAQISSREMEEIETELDDLLSNIEE